MALVILLSGHPGGRADDAGAEGDRHRDDDGDHLLLLSFVKDFAMGMDIQYIDILSDTLKVGYVHK